MRQLILISAFVLASASAQASDIGSLIPAANDTPAAAATGASFSAGTRSMRSAACAETEARAKAAMMTNLRT